MIGFLQKLLQKPSDFKIRLIRIIFALFLIFLIYFGWNSTRTEFGLPDEIKYVLYFFPAVGLIRGIFDPGLFRRRVWKWVIFSLGLSMMFISLFFIEDKEIIAPENPQGEIDASSLNNSEFRLPFTVSTDNWFGFLGFVVAFVGFFLTGKNITKKNEKYGEKIKKIRV